MWNLAKIFLPGFGLLVMMGMTSSLAGQQSGRQWSDATENYTFDATLIAHDDKRVILLRGDELVSMAVADLSEDDRKFLDSRKVAEQVPASPNGLQTWTLNNGLKVTGTIVDFAEREVTVRSHLGKTFVNDRNFDNLPAVYKEMVPQIVSHFEEKQFTNQRELESWLTWQPGKEKTYRCKGVLLELENGDRYGVPLFFFSDAEQAILNPAFQRWSSAQDVDVKEQESTNLRAQTQSFNQAKENQDVIQIRQIAEMQLQLQAYDSGLFDLWEVHLIPANDSWGVRRTVVVPGRNSDQAARAALQQLPGYQIGGIAKVRRKR